MQAHSGIVFVTADGGERRAALAVGPQVWTVAEAWLQHDKDERTVAVVADAVGLTTADVENALAYWADHRDEIDALIMRRHWSQDDGLAAWEPRRRLDAAERATIRFLLDEHYPGWLAEDQVLPGTPAPPASPSPLDPASGQHPTTSLPQPRSPDYFVATTT